jgi:hypothetical protein
MSVQQQLARLQQLQQTLTVLISEKQRVESVTHLPRHLDGRRLNSTRTSLVLNTLKFIG